MTLSSRQSMDTATSTILAYGVFFLLFIYYMLQYLDFPILSLSELAWNALVYMTPTQVISFLHPLSDLATTEEERNNKITAKSVGYARKNEAMRQFLGLDGKGIMSNVHRARSMSGIGVIMKGVPSTAPPGLGNWDNSCYQNSVLQGLAALRSLPKYLAHGTHAGATHSTKAALRDLLTRLNYPASVGKMFWTPAELKSMSSWQQQDAQEYFSKVLDEVEKESLKSADAASRKVGLAALASLERGSSKSQPRSLPASTGRATASSNSQATYQLPDELTSIVAQSPLEGLLAQRVGCLRCGYVEGLSLIPFNCLTVPLGGQWMYDIRSCLDEYTGLESIDGVECAKCTLLHTGQQLERVLSQIQNQAHGDDDPAMPAMLTALKDTSNERLAAVNAALKDEDFSDNTLLKKCQVNAKSRVSTTKSRQAVIARAPKALVIHVNRSVFDEITGAQTKNFADVRFPHRFDFSSWCLGGGNSSSAEEEAVERWITDPAVSMLSKQIKDLPSHLQKAYELRAVVTHYGRHENGHYICYKKYPSLEPSGSVATEESIERWWRLSDGEVSHVTEEDVLLQGGVFMLFYEQVEQLHDPVEGWGIEAIVSEQQTAGIAREKNQAKEAKSFREAFPAEDHSENDAAEANAALAMAEARLPPRHDDEPARHEHRIVEQSEIPQGFPKETRPADADSYTSPLPGAASDLTAVEQTNRTDSAYVHLSQNTHCSNVQPSTPPTVDSAKDVIPNSETTSSPPSPLEATKGNRQITPAMRTAPPRKSWGNMSRGGQGIEKASSMVTAN